MAFAIARSQLFILTGAEVDPTAGLLTLRERQAFTVFATDETLAALDANPMFRVLAADMEAGFEVAEDGMEIML